MSCKGGGWTAITVVAVSTRLRSGNGGGSGDGSGGREGGNDSGIETMVTVTGKRIKLLDHLLCSVESQKSHVGYQDQLIVSTFSYDF